MALKSLQSAADNSSFIQKGSFMAEEKKVITKVSHLENVIYSTHYKIETATL
ncbi:hypothetical protein N9I28_01265 [Flavobacteriaceae bacterium]|jgi:hypothetical protein|nr:hypothetical protein [Flavobacteriaceae bacterium]MDA8850860.1 hypothetical protein [Flavobacteriaceae bacterium]